MQKVSIITLGCKVNKYESECMASELIKNGYEVSFDLEHADIYIINSCAVTQMSEKKSRQYLAKINKINPGAKIIVCGCASENNAEQFKKDGLNVVVFGTQQKSNIINYINNIHFEKSDYNCTYENMDFPYINSTRAYLKIQDGCNNFCSYCLIPYVRGRSRSRDIQSIVTEAYELSNTAKEIVIVGINVSDYKIDNKLALSQLVLALKDVPSRFRFGSLEVNVVTEEFLKALKTAKNFAPHFHLSMQSGSNQVLKDMNRKYTKEEYLEKVKLIRSFFPNACITTDVIVGFPTETQELFEETVETIKQADFYNMHIFTYSAREGTVASKKYNMLNGTITKQRQKQLEEINQKLGAKYLNKQINKTLEFLLEEQNENFFIGRSENYLKVYMPKTNDIKPNTLYKVKILGLLNDGLIAEKL